MRKAGTGSGSLGRSSLIEAGGGGCVHGESARAGTENGRQKPVYTAKLGKACCYRGLFFPTAMGDEVRDELQLRVDVRHSASIVARRVRRLACGGDGWTRARNILELPRYLATAKMPAGDAVRTRGSRIWWASIAPCTGSRLLQLRWEG